MYLKKLPPALKLMNKYYKGATKLLFIIYHFGPALF